MQGLPRSQFLPLECFVYCFSVFCQSNKKQNRLRYVMTRLLQRWYYVKKSGKNESLVHELKERKRDDCHLSFHRNIMDGVCLQAKNIGFVYTEDYSSALSTDDTFRCCLLSNL